MSTKEPQTFPQTPIEWLMTPLGQSLLAQETLLIEETIEDVFGEECVQVGLWGDAGQFTQYSRTQRNTLLVGPDETGSAAGSFAIAESHRLPVASDSVDSIILPHTLDYSLHPHAVLREVHRVLRAGGHLTLLGFRPGGLWGLRRLIPGAEFPPGAEDLLSDRVLRDWMKLLDMRIFGVERYFFRWPLQGNSSTSTLWERRGRRFWPEMSACYMISAQKRVSTLTPVRPQWNKKAQVVGGLAGISRRVPRIRFDR